MSNQIEILIKMQQFDDMITERNELMKELPKELNSLRNKLDVTKDELSTAEQNLEENQKDQKLKELDIQTNNERIAKYKNQLLSIETNKEYKALNSEIHHLEDKNSQIDDILLEMMDEEQRLKKELIEAKENFNNAEAELKANEKRLEDKIELVKKEIDEIRAQRNKIAVELPKSMIKRYGALIKNKNRKAVVFNINDACSGCGFKVRPQLIIEINQGNKVVQCESCGRMLVKKT